MEIISEVVDNLTSIKLLVNSRKTNIPIIELDKLSIAEKNITSLKWENFVLEQRGDLTAYLLKNERETFKKWNELSRDAKERIIPIVTKKMFTLVEEKKIFESMIPQIRFDIINISIYLTIKNECMNVNSPFFDDLYTLYRLGYIPCGHAKGKYKVL